jgi:hypothetical protein
MLKSEAIPDNTLEMVSLFFTIVFNGFCRSAIRTGPNS